MPLTKEQKATIRENEKLAKEEARKAKAIKRTEWFQSPNRKDLNSKKKKVRHDRLMTLIERRLATDHFAHKPPTMEEIVEKITKES